MKTSNKECEFITKDKTWNKVWNMDSVIEEFPSAIESANAPVAIVKEIPIAKRSEIKQESVEIIIPIWNRTRRLVELTDNCLNSLYMNMLQKTLENLKVTVICNEFPYSYGNNGVKVVYNERNAGVTGSWIQGIAKSDADIIVISNNDVEFYPGWLEPLIKALENEKVAFASPQMIEKESDIAILEKQLGSFGTIDGIIGSCFAFRREIITRLGQFDKELDPYYSDMDMWRRAKSKGYHLVLAKGSYICHIGAATCNTLDDETMKESFNRCRRRFFEKWPRKRRR